MWLKLEPDGDYLKVTWGTVVEGLPVPHPFFYHITPQSLANATQQVRTELTNLAVWSSQGGTSAQRRIVLSGLARAGSLLRYELFRGHDFQEPGIAALKQWITDEYANGDTALAIQAPERLHLPWGLIFDGEPPAQQGPEEIPAEIPLFKGFWRFRRQLWITQIGTVPQGERIKGPHDSYGLISLYNPEALSAAQGFGDNPVDPIGKRYTPPIDAVFTVSDCRALINSATRGDIVFNFFGHHRNLQLILGNETLGYSEFDEMMNTLATRIRELRKSSWGIIFLNACASAVDTAEISLRRSANRSGLAGIIATEARVPTRYAAKFGDRFLTALIEKKQRVGDIMKEFDSDETLWPESLLYGFYVHPGYQISEQRAV